MQPLLKPSSGIGRGHRAGNGGIKRLRERAKQGIMPLGVQANWGEPRIKAYEILDKNYAMPDPKYLKKQEVEIGSWYTARDVTYGGEYLTREIHMPARSPSYVEVPINATESAMNGALKFELYHMLKRAGKLDETEFIRRKKK